MVSLGSGGSGGYVIPNPDIVEYWDLEREDKPCGLWACMWTHAILSAAVLVALSRVPSQCGVGFGHVQPNILALGAFEQTLSVVFPKCVCQRLVLVLGRVSMVDGPYLSQ